MSPNRCHRVTAVALLLAIAPSTALFADPEPAPAPSKNSVSNVSLRPDAKGNWLLDFDYVFTGDPPYAAFRVEVTLPEGANRALFRTTATRIDPPKAGAHHVATVLEYPGEGTSEHVVVSIIDPMGALATQRIDQVIVWPPRGQRAPMSPPPVVENFDTAVAMIENGSDDMVRRAKIIIEGLIAKDPNFDPGYVELARIAMRQNWGPEGLHQAETLIDSALKIRPDSANAKILLGYVYAHQRRFRQAEALFVEASRSNPPNAWLWTNWGELLAMRGDIDGAIVKYREAIARESTIQNWHARINAYAFLIDLLEQRHDADGMEALYEQRIRDLGPSSCTSTDYARFKLNVRHDAQGAIDIARAALNRNCEDTPLRRILGLASYVKWSESKGGEDVAALNEARIFLPAGPLALYLLASNDSSASAAKKLVANGEPIDQKDNDEMTALALALQNGDGQAAQRLLALGANPETLVSAAAIPVALLPVVTGDLEAIGILREAGVDYSKLRYRGATAIDFAKQRSDDALIEALTPKGSTL